MDKTIELTIEQLFLDITDITLDIIDTLPLDEVKHDKLMVAVLMSFSEALKRGLYGRYKDKEEYDA